MHVIIILRTNLPLLPWFYSFQFVTHTHLLFPWLLPYRYSSLQWHNNSKLWLFHCGNISFSFFLDCIWNEKKRTIEWIAAETISIRFSFEYIIYTFYSCCISSKLILQKSKKKIKRKKFHTTGYLITINKCPSIDSRSTHLNVWYFELQISFPPIANLLYYFRSCWILCY